MQEDWNVDDGQLEFFTFSDRDYARNEVLFDPRSIAPVPLPAGMPLLVGGLVALGLLRRKRQHSEQ